PPAHRHDPDPPDPTTPLRKALLVPPAQRALPLKPQPPPGDLDPHRSMSRFPTLPIPCSRQLAPRGVYKVQKATPTGPFSPVLLPMIVARGAASPLAPGA